MIVAPLIGPRLVLRNLHPEDVTERYLRWLQDDEVTAFLEVRRNPPRQLAELLDFVVSANASPSEVMFGMFVAGGTQHIGNIKLGPIDGFHGVGEIGLLIGDKAAWGKGYACEAIDMVSLFAFATLGLAKVTAGCYAANVGSARAFENAGFTREGVRPLQWKTAGGRVDGLLLGRLNPDMSAM